MHDQAEVLRKKALDTARQPKTIAVISGKGGVGKSNFSLNFSISLGQQGSRILLIDFDIGMGNIDILLGNSSPHTMADYLTSDVTLDQTIVKGTEGVDYIAGGSGLNYLINLDFSRVDQFIEDLQGLITHYDYLIFDMGAGMDRDTQSVLLSVNEIIVITTPEPPAMMDAYAVMKYIHHLNPNIPFYLVANRVSSVKEGKETLARLSEVLERFLGKKPVQLGLLPDDHNVVQAVKRQIPFLILNRKSPVSKAIVNLTERYLRDLTEDPFSRLGITFTARLKQFLFERQ
ncbi:MinD/ParA family protein [Mesobacillus harenae]|uniref:MinD/ParA family protein n=1 Tax=Mesobacillus harenae TaxID=2213203 RepID=UPI001580C761|nr:MinD/ParA family protein [Mesobacillus harenae]